MVCEIRTTDRFEKEAKKLIRKYASLKRELIELGQLLVQNPTLGTPIGKGFHKVRLAVKSKGRGKSGGARVITYLIIKPSMERLYLTSIYDKSERTSITEKELVQIISEIRPPF